MRTLGTNTSPYKAIGGSPVVVKPAANGNGVVGNNNNLVAAEVTELRKFIPIQHMTRDQINEKKGKDSVIPVMNLMHLVIYVSNLSYL